MHGRTAQPRFFVILSVIAALVFVAGTTMVRTRMMQDARRLAEVRLEQQALVDEISQLEQQIELRRSENEDLAQLLAQGDLNAFVEKRARDEDLGYVYPDERVYYDLNAGQ